MTTRTGIILASLIAGLGLAASATQAADPRVMTGNPTAEDFIEALSPPQEALTRGIKPRDTEATEPVYSDLPIVTFEFDSAELTPEARKVLDELAAALRSDQLGTSRFVIEGHTDAVGSDAYNQQLSEQRARSVRQYLAGKQVDPSRLQVVGKGKDELLDPANPAAAINRRVRVVNLGG